LLSGTSASFIHGAVKAAGSFEDGARYRALVFGLEHAPASVPAPPIHLQPGIPFAIASVVGAVSIAMLALYRTRLLPLAGSRVVNILDSPLLLLRRAHSGHVGDYVAWMMVGVVAFGAGFAMVVR
ncbi:MAG TPA: hypothetical protein VE975_00010, partial [Actinomycetota bacterium]|nr:hypothetical protein [Actinomycetota bacterium]